MPEWTPVRVEERLRKAVVLRGRLSGYAKELAPDGDGIGGIGGIGGIRVTAVGAGEDEVVADAVEALAWLNWLDPVDAQLVLARLEGARWKLICWRFGISRPTADRRLRYALSLIAWRLNGHAASSSVPSLRSLLKRRCAPRAGRETFLSGTGR